eukprot:497235_1
MFHKKCRANVITIGSVLGSATQLYGVTKLMDFVLYPNSAIILVRIYGTEDFRRNWTKSKLIPALKRLVDSWEAEIGWKRKIILEFVCCDDISWNDLSRFLQICFQFPPADQYIPYWRCYSADRLKKDCSASLLYLFEYFAFPSSSVYNNKRKRSGDNDVHEPKRRRIQQRSHKMVTR